MYIEREAQLKIENLFSNKTNIGLIVSGIVGCGKTTAISKAIENLQKEFQILSFTGDDVQFRQIILGNSSFLLNEVKSKTSKKALVFVDEVQKCEEIFDALKILFDSNKYSFIVSGSNPAYLSTIAKKRLQRRADLFFMTPLSLMEIYSSQVEKLDFNFFEEMLFECKSVNNLEVPKIDIAKGLNDLELNYFVFGGLPLAHKETKVKNKLKEIRLTVERGFDLLSVDNNSISEFTRVELAKLHGKEFTYKNLLERTRLKKREPINKVIDDLINHGYLTKRKPILLSSNKTSYLSIFSFNDPGIVSYLTGNYDLKKTIGQQVEGYIHSRLNYYIVNSPFKSELGYYKPFVLDKNDHIKYVAGEIDFIVKNGNQIIPIEVKSAHSINQIEAQHVVKFVSQNKCPFGIVIYGGVPSVDVKTKIVYWPYWYL